MINYLRIFSLTFIFYACHYIKTDEKEQNQPIIPDAKTCSELKNDTLCIDIVNHDLQNFAIHVEQNGKSTVYDLNELGIDWKTPELHWFSSNFACIATWWSADISNELFIPLNSKNELIHIKNIKASDQVYHNVLYVENTIRRWSSGMEEVHYVAENLISRKQIRFYEMFRYEDFPANSWHDSIKMNQFSIEMWEGGKKREVDIHGIY